MSDSAKGALLLSSFIPPGGREGRNPDDDRRIVSEHLANGNFLNALGITTLYTRDDDLPIEHIAWFKIAKAECFLRAGKLDDAKSSLHEALEYRALLTNVQVAQALRLKANVLKSLGEASGTTNPLMMEASDLDGGIAYWNWSGRLGNEIYAWTREEAMEVRKAFAETVFLQAKIDNKKVWRTYTVC